MSSIRLTLEQRRGSEAVLRDLEGRRWVAPTSALPDGLDSMEVLVETARKPEPTREVAEPAAREFLSRLLSAS